MAHEKRGSIDYALVKSDSASIVQSNFPITTIYQPALREDVGRSVYLLTRTGFKRTICRSIRSRIGPPYSQEVLNGVILTDAISKVGDSGGALVDQHSRLWGFLIGSLPGVYSVFMPVTKLLERQNLRIGA